MKAYGRDELRVIASSVIEPDKPTRRRYAATVFPANEPPDRYEQIHRRVDLRVSHLFGTD
ncbi:MAG: hypothetical protein IRZ16_00245 [Myxococcaceae bacterium]|nr:hypothetical protein [Myxococcaceae bacterium]